MNKPKNKITIINAGDDKAWAVEALKELVGLAKHIDKTKARDAADIICLELQKPAPVNVTIDGLTNFLWNDDKLSIRDIVNYIRIEYPNGLIIKDNNAKINNQKEVKK